MGGVEVGVLKLSEHQARLLAGREGRDEPAIELRTQPGAAEILPRGHLTQYH
ncbi:MAG: hypothetical protein L0H41_07360 [Microlunatus sp.]|nr:hypothetical protein [Microlunatus sp.]